MVDIESLAEAANAQEALALRSLVQDLLREHPHAESWSRPTSSDPRILSIAAALAELLAGRLGQSPPAWTSEIGAAPEPFFLLKAAGSLKHLRLLCLNESPPPLRRRGIFAPPNFLEFA